MCMFYINTIFFLSPVVDRASVTIGEPTSYDSVGAFGNELGRVLTDDINKVFQQTGIPTGEGRWVGVAWGRRLGGGVEGVWGWVLGVWRRRVGGIVIGLWYFLGLDIIAVNCNGWIDCLMTIQIVVDHSDEALLML